MNRYGRALSGIYWSMEKIIYIYALKEAKQKTGIWQRLQNTLSLSYPVEEKKVVLADFPVSGYGIKGPDAAEIAALPESGNRKEQQRGGWRRLRRTLKKIEKRMQKKEMQKMTRMSQNAFLFFQWEDCIFPAELLLGFYENCRKENVFVFRAEQLIFLDGWEPPQEKGEEAGREIEWDESENVEMTFMSGIYSTYNYVTIVTRRKEAWETFVDTAYEEYGLSVRCTADSGNLTFREKATLVVDLCRSGRDCCRAFPKSSVYMDLREDRDKMHQISVKCREIPYISLRNTLDTMLKDTV